MSEYVFTLTLQQLGVQQEKILEKKKSKVSSFHHNLLICDIWGNTIEEVFFKTKTCVIWGKFSLMSLPSSQSLSTNPTRVFFLLGTNWRFYLHEPALPYSVPSFWVLFLLQITPWNSRGNQQQTEQTLVTLTNKDQHGKAKWSLLFNFSVNKQRFFRALKQSCSITQPSLALKLPQPPASRIIDDPYHALF